MSFRCLKCCVNWDYEDYTCPCCNGATVDPDNDMEPDLEYRFDGDSYDVIRLETGKSVFDEPENYTNKGNKLCG